MRVLENLQNTAIGTDPLEMGDRVNTEMHFSRPSEMSERKWQEACRLRRLALGDAGEPERFLGATPFCDFLEPRVMKTVSKLVRRGDKDRTKAVKIFNWVRDRIVYEPGYRNEKASDVLSRGRGSCSSKANLLVAMLRAVDVPAAYFVMHVKGGDYFGRALHPMVSYWMSSVSVHFYAAYYNSELGRFVRCDPSDDSAIGESLKVVNAPQTRVVDFDGIHDALLHFRPEHIFTDIGPLRNADGLLDKRVERTAELTFEDVLSLSQFLADESLSYEEAHVPTLFAHTFRQKVAFLAAELDGNGFSEAAASYQAEMDAIVRGADLSSEVKTEVLHFLVDAPRLGFVPQAFRDQFPRWARGIALEVSLAETEIMSRLWRDIETATLGFGSQFWGRYKTWQWTRRARVSASDPHLVNKVQDHCHYVGLFEGRLSRQLKASYLQFLGHRADMADRPDEAAALFAKREAINDEADLAAFHQHIFGNLRLDVLAKVFDFGRTDGMYYSDTASFVQASLHGARDRDPARWSLYEALVEREKRLYSLRRAAYEGANNEPSTATQHEESRTGIADRTMLASSSATEAADLSAFPSRETREVQEQA